MTTDDDAVATKAMAAGGKVTPDSMKAAQHRKMAEPGSAS